MNHIIETSRTTGSAKRVIYNEQALLALAEVEAVDLNITGESVINIDRWGISALRRFYLARVSGARLAVYPGHEIESLREWINNEGVTYLGLLASTFRWVCGGLYRYPSVRLIEIGGEMVDWGDVALARECFPNAVFANRYACSEAHMICRKIVEREQPTGTGRMPVGKPVRGVNVVIMADNGLTYATADKKGEMLVKSPYLADGYYNDPQLTAAKFKNGWYHTGDLGYWTADRELMHCGRMDFQGEAMTKFNADTKSTHDESIAKWTLAGG